MRGQRRAMNWDSMFFRILQLLVVAVPALSSKSISFRPTPRRSPLGGNLQLLVQHTNVVMDNGLVQVTLTLPGGFVAGVQYKGSKNILEPAFGEEERGYWDMTWGKGDNISNTEKISSTKFEVIRQDKSQIELSFSSTWKKSDDSSYPVNIDRRFVMLHGKTGFYCYGILERLRGWPDLDIDEARIVFKLDKNKFRYMAVSDTRQRIMPLPEDRATGRPLAYPEAVLLTNAVNPSLRGQVDDKYMYSCNNMDGQVYGWVSSNLSLGFWMITPSNEFRTGGPLKQDLTSHVGPTTLAMFVSLHYAGKGTGLEFRNGEPWKKVFGPVFVYLNSLPPKTRPNKFWKDAKYQMLRETQSWPYSFPLSEDYTPSNKRGRVTGQLRVCDRYSNVTCTVAKSAHVGLAAPGLPGSWQFESKSYQFWVQTDKDGKFVIPSVRPGVYNLYGFVPGVIGDYKRESRLVIGPGSTMNLGVLIYYPRRSGPTLWEIGIPDRTAIEFYIPAPNPKFVNPLYLNQDRFRQYGLWERYSVLYPKHDLVYTVGVSDYTKDWFYAHVPRIVGDKKLRPSTWKIQFVLDNVSPTQTYVLQIAIASSNMAELQVRINDDNNNNKPLFTTRQIGKDNGIARHGIHGIYALYSINIRGSHFVNGRNVIFLTQARCLTPFEGLMYDYLRLEGPAGADPGHPHN